MTTSIQRSNGMFFVVASFKDAETGKWRQKWLATGIPVKDGIRKAKEVKNAVLGKWAGPERPAGGDVLFCEYIKAWVEASKTRIITSDGDVVSPTTITSYESMLKKHIFPYFEGVGVSVDSVTQIHIQAYYDGLRGVISPNTIRKHHSIIRSVLQKAVDDGVITSNPAVKAKRPDYKKPRISIYTAEQVKVLLKLVEGTSMMLPIYLAANFGLRRSEALGLRWSSIDFEAKKLYVEHKVVRAKVNGKLKVLATDRLKTDASKRAFPLSKKHIAFLRKVQQDIGDMYSPEAYVCVFRTGHLEDKRLRKLDGKPIMPDYVTHELAKVIKQHKLPHITYHGLRHTCACLLLKAGHSMKEIQEWLGHSNFETTANIYTQIYEEEKAKMSDTIADLYE